MPRNLTRASPASSVPQCFCSQLVDLVTEKGAQVRLSDHHTTTPPYARERELEHASMPCKTLTRVIGNRELRSTSKVGPVGRRKLAAAANLFCHAITANIGQHADAEGTRKNH